MIETPSLKYAPGILFQLDFFGIHNAMKYGEYGKGRCGMYVKLGTYVFTISGYGMERQA